MQSVNYSLASLVGGDIQIVSKDESYVRRALHLNIGPGGVQIPYRACEIYQRKRQIQGCY